MELAGAVVVKDTVERTCNTKNKSLRKLSCTNSLTTIFFSTSICFIYILEIMVPKMDLRAVLTNNFTDIILFVSCALPELFS